MELYEPPGDSVRKSMEKLIAKYHPDLADISDRIAVIFQEKASKAGGQTVLGRVSKASSEMRLLGRKDWVFVIKLPGDLWQDASEKQRAAMIDRQLCACSAKYDEEANEVKYSVKSPDLSFFSPEVKRWGIWMDLDEGETEDTAGVIEDLFFEDEEGAEPIEKLFRLFQRGVITTDTCYAILGISPEDLDSNLKIRSGGSSE
jgi:hypothetical protein